MKNKARIRLALVAIFGVAIILPVAAYGRDSSGPTSERASIDALVSLDTGFNFQGRLTDAGAPANGVYDFNFFLYDAAAGGSQVGPVQAVGDVTVTAGLFTVKLNFGDVFHGAKYFLDMQVRPGVSVGTYTILSPREPIDAVPNASYATEAGSLALPSSGTQGFAGALLKLTNSNTGPSTSAFTAESASAGGGAAAIIGRITATGGGNSAGVRGINDGTGSPMPGVYGSNAGSGYGVQGSSVSGIGVLGQATSGTGVLGASTSGSAGHFESVTGDAIELYGPISVGGTRRAAFIHTHTVEAVHTTVIDHPSTNDNPNAMLQVTQRWEGTYNPHPIGVFYSGGKWRIFNEDIAAMPLGAKFNVFVINQ